MPAPIPVRIRASVHWPKGHQTNLGTHAEGIAAGACLACLDCPDAPVYHDDLAALFAAHAGVDESVNLHRFALVAPDGASFRLFSPTPSPADAFVALVHGPLR